MNDENTNAASTELEGSAPGELEPESDLVGEIEAPPAEELAEPVAPPEPPAAAAPPEVATVPPVYPPPPPPPPGTQYAPPPAATEVRGGAAEKSKVVAGVLGILLGGLGIHKFYLGYTNEGIIMLAGNLLWVVGLGWVPNVVGLIEGVIYLFKTDQEFYETYVVGTKKWF